eukprot:TRINITY_DN271_c0_g3_i1.p1 TRINITY_DN271_c0_g3~~TRINITY_DN271_c0_g3_i1.p1  ORF type:complete len:280 (-),score=62.81 TRINITY_DN271_c0_g3_i1:6-845(-)
MPLAATIHQISNLFNTIYFPNDPHIGSKRSALNSALKDYCNYLLKQGQVSYCGSPPPSPPPPPPSIFGGIYQQDACNQANVQNIYTGALNCKSGYTPSVIGRYIAGSNCQTTQFVCLLDGQSSDPLRSYGGQYQIYDDFPQLNIVNPVTKTLGCAAGYTSAQTGRVLIGYDRYHVWGASQFMCYNASNPLTKTTTAGGYQTITGSAEDNVANPYTQAESCPSGFTAYMSGSIVGPETSNLSTGYQYVCLNNIFAQSSSSLVAPVVEPTIDTTGEPQLPQ